VKSPTRTTLLSGEGSSLRSRPGSDLKASDPPADQHPAYQSFGWARANGLDGAATQAWLQTASLVAAPGRPGAVSREPR